MRSRGLARIYDVLMACVIILVGSGMSMNILLPAEGTTPPPDLHGLASECLSYMDQKEILAPLVYSQSSGQLQNLLSTLLPLDVGYRLTVYDINWNPLMVIGTGLNGASASSACYYLGGWNGTADPRIIVLALSR